MKKIFFLTFMLVSAVMSFAQTKKVAILEVVDREGKLSYSQKLLLRSNMAYAVTKTNGYEAYDRSDVDMILNEHEFQRTGLVSTDQIKQIEMAGANMILVVEGVLTTDKKMLVAVKLLDVETAKVIKTDNSIMGLASDEMKSGCELLARKVFGKEKKHAKKLVSKSGNPIFLGLNASINTSCVFRENDYCLGGGIGFDFAYPLCNKFALGFYFNAALFGPVDGGPANDVYQLNPGLLMLAGDLKSRPFIIGIVPYSGVFVPRKFQPFSLIGIRFGRVLNKHLYIDVNLSYGISWAERVYLHSKDRAYNASLNVGYHF